MNGRFLKFREIQYHNDWPVTECLNNVPITSSDNYFFISHRWITQEHPDPNNLKWNKLKFYYEELERLKQRIEIYAPKDINSNVRKNLCLERKKIPLLTKQDNDDFNMWESGFKPVNPHWLDDDTTGAARLFKDWILKSIKNVQDGDLWIDSFATSERLHRTTCPRCTEEHIEILKSIPDIVRNGVCLKLTGFKNDENERGWIILESCIAYINQRLFGAYNIENWNIIDGFQAIYSLNYKCSYNSDAETIPLILALSKIMKLLGDLTKDFLKNPESINTIYEKIKKIYFNSIKENDLISNISRVLSELRKREFISSLPLLGYHKGLFLTNLYLELIRGLIGHCAKRKNILLTTPKEELVFLQSCVYYFLSDTKLDSHTATIYIISHWQYFNKIELAKISTTINTKNHFEINRIMRYWLESQENLINILGNTYIE